MRQN
jgi:uncharacterized protein YfkK (UPF0435 family)